MKFDWSNYCCTTENRNQCSEESCSIYKICLIKKTQKTSHTTNAQQDKQKTKTPDLHVKSTAQK